MDMIVFHVACIIVLLVEHTWALPFLNSFTTTVTQTSGKAAVLTCQVEDLANSKVIWIGPSGTLLTVGGTRRTTDIRFSVENPFPLDWNLRIDRVKPSDAGQYTCKVESIPPQTKRVNLKVKVSPKLDYRKSTKTPLHTKEGENVTLSCIVTAEPEASVIWSYFHPRLEGSKEQLDHYPKSTIGDIISIHEISRDQAGVYECIAFNGVPHPLTRNVTVHVEFQPKITITSKEINQYRGKNTLLECNVNAFPLDNYGWRKGDTEIQQGVMDWKYSITLFERSATEYSLTLQIFSLEPDDFGSYTCEVDNEHGNASASVLVKEMQVIVPSTKASTTTKSTTTTLPTTTTLTSSTKGNTTLSSAKTTPVKLVTTTKSSGIIIDGGGNGDNDPHYSVVTTPNNRPITPADQDTRNAASSLTMAALSLTFLLLPLLV